MAPHYSHRSIHHDTITVLETRVSMHVGSPSKQSGPSPALIFSTSSRPMGPLDWHKDPYKQPALSHHSITTMDQSGGSREIGVQPICHAQHLPSSTLLQHIQSTNPEIPHTALSICRAPFAGLTKRLICRRAGRCMNTCVCSSKSGILTKAYTLITNHSCAKDGTSTLVNSSINNMRSMYLVCCRVSQYKYHPPSARLTHMNPVRSHIVLWPTKLILAGDKKLNYARSPLLWEERMTSRYTTKPLQPEERLLKGSMSSGALRVLETPVPRHKFGLGRPSFHCLDPKRLLLKQYQQRNVTGVSSPAPTVSPRLGCIQYAPFKSKTFEPAYRTEAGQFDHVSSIGTATHTLDLEEEEQQLLQTREKTECYKIGLCEQTLENINTTLPHHTRACTYDISPIYTEKLITKTNLINLPTADNDGVRQPSFIYEYNLQMNRKAASKTKLQTMDPDMTQAYPTSMCQPLHCHSAQQEASSIFTKPASQICRPRKPLQTHLLTFI